MFRLRVLPGKLSTRVTCSAPRAVSPASFHLSHSSIRGFSVTANMSNGIGIMSISDAIKHDHRELEDYYNKIKSATDDDTKVRYQNQFVWELARHSIAEEIVVYPALEEHVDNGREIADKDRQEHLVVKKRLYKFQKMYPKDAEFIPVLDGLMKTLQGHIKDEEKHDLVALEGGIEGTQSEDLAKSFKRTKLFVPTQSHPSAPDKPPFETVAGLLSAPLDKLMDMFKKFPKD